MTTRESRPVGRQSETAAKQSGAILDRPADDSAQRSALKPNIAAILDRLTDPRQDALADVRQALDQLSGEIAGLKTATDREGEECKDDLWMLAALAEDAVDRLAGTLKDGGGR